MATKSMEGSPLLTYEADEGEGRKAFFEGKQSDDCPFPTDKGDSIRRVAWMRGYYAAKYWDRHKFRSGWDE